MKRRPANKKEGSKQRIATTALLVVICASLLPGGCRKSGKGCWQAFDPVGYGDAPGLVLCDKTKAEAEAAYPQYWFYKQDEEKFCWQAPNGSGNSYLGGIPKTIAEKYSQERGLSLTVVSCNSFCVLTWHEKHKGKLSNQYGPTYVVSEVLLSADTCSKLSAGKIVVVRETADSLVTRELVSKMP